MKKEIINYRSISEELIATTSGIGKYDPDAITILRSGFLEGKINPDDARVAIESLIRLEMAGLDHESIILAITAAISKNQDSYDIIRVATETMIGIPYKENLIDYELSVRMLKEIISSGNASEIVFDVFRKGVSSGDQVVLRNLSTIAWLATKTTPDDSKHLQELITWWEDSIYK